MLILNSDFFGYILVPKSYATVNEAATDFLYIKLKTLGELSLTHAGIL